MPLVFGKRVQHVVSKVCNVKIDRLPEQHMRLKTLPPSHNLTSHVDLRERFPPVYDQGQIGSSTASALCALFGYDAPELKGSRLFLYYNERKLENNLSDDQGVLLSEGIKALEKYGLCSEADWPYVAEHFAERPSDECYKKAVLQHVIAAYNLPTTRDSMRHSLQLGQPFVIGILLFDSFMHVHVSETGNVMMPSQQDKILGGHAVVCVGYNDDKQAWIMRNSWGENWGDHGHFYLPYEYLENPQLSSDAWSISKAQRVVVTVKPVEQKKPEVYQAPMPAVIPAAPMPAVIPASAKPAAIAAKPAAQAPMPAVIPSAAKPSPSPSAGAKPSPSSATPAAKPAAAAVAKPSPSSATPAAKPAAAPAKK